MEYLPTLQSALDTQKPSLFELLSEHQLAALIPPSLRYLLTLATHRQPRYLLRILNSFDELYALLSLIVERHYLRTHGGGFTENFYGLKRERVLRTKGGEVRRAGLGARGEVRETLGLRRGDVWRNLAVMVALPYAKRKLDEGYEIHAAGLNVLGPAYREREGEGYPWRGTLRERVRWVYRWFLRRVYPSVNAAYYFALLAFNLAYLFDGSRFHSPFLWLIGTRMRRLDEADARALAVGPSTQTGGRARAGGVRPGQTRSIFSPRVMTETVFPRLLSSLKILLPTSIFALKFLEWWHASDFARQLSRKANEGLQLPPPIIDGLPPPTTTTSREETKKKRRDSGPSTSPPISTTTNLPILTVPAPTHTRPESGSSEKEALSTEATAHLCPICTSAIQTPTAAQTGFVYCYTCIYKWVEGSHPRQEAFMEGSAGEEDEEGGKGWVEEGGGSRVGRWESGKGRDAVTGRRVLGGTGGLRRVMV